ncbi:MAG TPA: IclR family transcriptional regulator [Thermoleophilaceae bacterium]|jgi:IclR family pca regulon transcriptional regulator
MEAAQTEYRVEALARGLRILSAFSEQRAALPLKRIAELTDIPLPTAFRLVATLEAEGFVERLPSGEYQPGPGVLTLGFAALQSNDLVDTAQAPLRKLANDTGQSVNLGTLSGDQVLYLARIRNEARLVTSNVQVGSLLPAAVTSMGKLLLAELPKAELDELLRGIRFTPSWGPNAPRSAGALRSRLKEVLKQGYAIQDEELTAGLRSIAGPVRGPDGAVVAAVNIAVPASELTMAKLVSTLKAPLLATCADISRRLGAPPG